MIFRKNISKYLILFIVLAIYCTIFFRFISGLDAAAVGPSGDSIQPPPRMVTEGWQYHWGDSPRTAAGSLEWLTDTVSQKGWNSFQFPGRPENPDEFNEIWIRAILPKGEWKHPTLRFRAPQQALELYLDGKSIYTYGNIQDPSRVRTPGSIWHLVELPADFAGKTVQFRLHSPFPQYTGYLIEIAAGDRSTHVIDILKENGISVIFGSLFILIGVALLLLQITGSSDWRFLIFLGLSSICMGGWYISESKLLQLFFDAPVSITYAANFFIFLMPVWLVVYFERSFHIKARLLKILLRISWMSHAMLALIALTSDMAGLISSLYFDKILHVLLPITMILITCTVVNSSKGGLKTSLPIMASILILGITGLFDTFTLFYNTFPVLRIVKISYLGMLIFLMTLLLNVSKELKNLYENMKNNSIENATNYKSLFTNMTDGFTYNRVETDNFGRIQKCVILESNNSFIEKSGLEPELLIGSDLFCIYPELRELNMGLSRAYDESAPAVDLCADKNQVKLGDKWYKLSAFCPKKGHLSMIFSDITVMKHAEETIRHQAYTDSMTGFYNRTYFEEVMLRLHGKMRQIKPISIVAIDIDGLKITNDTFGHNAGDELLIRSAEIISSVFAGKGIITRVGGDEFCVILEQTDSETARNLAEQLVRETREVNRKSPIVPVSMSIGVATSSESGSEDIYSIYKQADDNMYLYKISQSSSEKSKVIDMLLSALSERDFVSQGHVERLIDLCAQMSEALNLHDIQKRNLVLLSKVHDLGKIGVPDEILNKPARLTTEEYEKMKQHVKIGYNIASRSKELVAIAPLILHHHEHWNGNGYPDALRGEDIPLECRILGILDAFDSMTNDRPYHQGIPVTDALGVIHRGAGTQFDPNLVGKFMEIMSGSLRQAGPLPTPIQ